MGNRLETAGSAWPETTGDTPCAPCRRRSFLARSGAALLAAGTLLRGPGRTTPAAQTGNLADPPARPRVSVEPFGAMPDGSRVDRYTLESPTGLRARVITFGATLTVVEAPDRAGRLAPITLYLDTLDDYLGGHPLFGSVVGRYANRIAGARFVLDGTEYPLEANAGKHHIHGGRQAGFQRLLWQAEPIEQLDAAGVMLRLTSPDGAAGFPGRLEATVAYQLTSAGELVIDYTAQTDKPTHVNLTNHAYWNLAGAGSGDVLGHLLYLNADHYLVPDDDKIPTGVVSPVQGTPLDFTTPATIGSRIEQLDWKNYDHCYVLNKRTGERLELAARLTDPASGRVMEVLTTQPGVQLYTAKGLSDRLGADGRHYGPYHGVCLETQHFPDSPNRAEFPSTVLRPGDTYHQTTVHRFATTGNIRHNGKR